VKVLCDSCRGRRFNSETLSILWRGKSIGDLLEMNIDDAVEFFAAQFGFITPCGCCRTSGLAISRSGSPRPTLSAARRSASS
jgi:excinuclease ABC subunit A